MTISKTIQLGIIVLAFDVLRELKIPVPRLVAMAALALGVSRKAGYQARERLLKALAAGNEPASEELKREVFTLRIRNQILNYERDHSGVRFEDREHHLPAEAKSLAVRIFRDFREMLSESEVATVLGVPLTSLRRWDQEANSAAELSSKPERRGTHRRFSAEDAQRVVDEYKSLQKPLTLEEFTQRFNAKYPQKTLGRKAITRILQRAGLRDVKRKDESTPYHEPFRVYFPGAQISLDGTKCDVVFTSQPQETITLSEEVAIDIATGTILGDALGQEENAEGVEGVLMQARRECESILAVLSDNGSANTSERIQLVAKEGTELGQIFSFPAHPWTNGHVEGVFGQFSRIAGKIEIDDSSRQALARSVVTVIWRIYIHFHNHSPRDRLDGLSPLEYLRRYHAESEEVQAAKAGLGEQKKRSESHRKPHPRRSDERFRNEIERIVKTHGLDVAIDDAVGALLSFDSQAIHSASNVLYSYSKRDGFDERKRTFAYFMGIVRNKQKELDAGWIQTHLGTLQTQQVLDDGDQVRRHIEKEKAEEDLNLRTQPERVILQYAEMLLAGRLRFLREMSLKGLRRGIKALRQLGRGTTAAFESLKATIQAWGKYSEELKQDMVVLLATELAIAAEEFRASSG